MNHQSTMSAQEGAKLPAEGFAREKQILEVLPISRATWRRWIDSGKAPKPVRLSEGIVAWRVEEVRALLVRLAA